MVIDASTTLEELAFLVGHALQQHGIHAVLTGGAVVSFYTENRYASLDLDFVAHATRRELDTCMASIGFARTSGRHYTHPETDFIVEFPSPPLAIGNHPVDQVREVTDARGYLRLLTPTQCVMDRLAAYFWWKDQQSFHQAILVAKAQPIDLQSIADWARAEGHTTAFATFEKAVRVA